MDDEIVVTLLARREAVRRESAEGSSGSSNAGLYGVLGRQAAGF